MKETERQKNHFPARTTHRLRAWLLGTIVAVLLLMAAAVLLVPRLIDFAAVKQKIQAVVTEQTGGKIDYDNAELSYFPRPSIELRQVKLTIPELAEGTVAALRASPAFLPLLVGDLRLARLELDTPQLSLELPDTKPKETPAQPFTFTGLELQVDNGRLAIARSKQKQVELEGLSLQSDVSMAGVNSARANLQANIVALNIYRNGRQETTKGLSLSGSAQMTGDKTTVKLERLALAEPALELTGDMTLAPTTPAITLNLSGNNIDVEATRRTALALAGDITPVEKIFDYLRGGRVPQLSFTSRGEDLSELGDMNNILIKGRLQDGKVSIPKIDLDLTEVFGDVVVSRGVLQGTGLSARLDESAGRDGSLKIGLTKKNDLFQLDLMLRADLADTKAILQRVVSNPAIASELQKITGLQGTGHGKLSLGDSLHDIDAGIEVSEVTLSADYQGVPLPITIAGGQLAFSNDRLDLDSFSGSLGESQFADLSILFNWEKDLSLDIGSGRFDLNMAELYPWLASLEGLRDTLQEVKQVSGRVELSVFELKGEVDRPSAWQFSSTGTVQDLTVDTKAFPDIINIAGGGLKIDTQQVTFEKLKVSSQDAAFILSGSINGWPQQLQGIELLLDGSMGPQSVEWLSNILNVPESYAIIAPLSIGNAQVAWQPDDSTASFKGEVSLEKGPAIIADVDYRPGQLQVNRLHLNDRYSDADMVFDFNKDQHDFKFTGKLQHETLQSMFVDGLFNSGQLEGDIAVTIPQSGHSKATATGQLTGENLPVLLPSGDEINIEQITLQADGPQVQVDITKLTWKNFTWEPVEGTVSFDRDRVDLRLAKAGLCDINSIGSFSFTGDEFSLDLTLLGRDLDVATSYTCLTEGRTRATGSLDFSSRVTAKGQMDELVNGLEGPLEMTLSNGLIKQNKLVSRILEVLNVTEIVKGRLPDLATTGFAYTTMTLQGEFQNGKLIIHEFFMDGETLDLVGYGEIRLEDQTLDIQLLAAPLKTVDTIIKHIPGVNYLLGGSLVAIPVGITGSLDDPRVAIMSPSAVGSSLLDLAERAITSPFKLLEKINPWSK